MAPRRRSCCAALAAARSLLPPACSFLLLLLCCEARPLPGCRGSTLEGCPGTANCTVRYVEQWVDHFNWAPPLGGTVASTFKMRYYVNEQWWHPGGPIFFYFGNEDDVGLYVNHTGIMWESAEDFGALLVFAEHRYYGESLPFRDNVPGCMSWLTTEQAMADYVYLLDELQKEYGQGSRLPAVGFGGSYGGMLGAWFRMKYPAWVDGVIAGSAPIWSFDGLSPAYDFNAYNQGVTYDASAAGGASDGCKNNLKAAWPRIIAAGQSPEGRALLSESFRACSPVQAPGAGRDDPLAITDWVTLPWASLAMGNYPYPSSYLMHGLSILPAWPLQEACRHLDAEFAGDGPLFEAVRRAAATYYNNTGALQCFDIFGGGQSTPKAPLQARRLSRRPGQPAKLVDREGCMGDWDYQWCTEMVQPFTQGTPEDMFFCKSGGPYSPQNCAEWNFTADAERCQADWGVRPRKEWARLNLGSKDLRGVSNIVFSNGRLDPWSRGGVMENVSDTVLAVVLPNGAHHLDFMFSDPLDAGYPDIAAARDFERAQMRRWVSEATPAGGGPRAREEAEAMVLGAGRPSDVSEVIFA